MKRRLCPQCKIPNFYVLNEKKERRLVFVTVYTYEQFVACLRNPFLRKLAGTGLL